MGVIETIFDVMSKSKQPLRSAEIAMRAAKRLGREDEWMKVWCTTRLQLSRQRKRVKRIKTNGVTTYALKGAR